MNEDVAQNVEKKGMSTGAKWGTGCGIGCLAIIIILAIAGFVGFKLIKQKIDETADNRHRHDNGKPGQPGCW